ncbi:MAG TPA: hypothetical protein VIL37_00455 [Natronosporangium sp.]
MTGPATWRSGSWPSARYAAGDHSTALPEPHLFTATDQLHLIFVEYTLVAAAFLVSGWLVGVGFVRLGWLAGPQGGRRAGRPVAGRGCEPGVRYRPAGCLLPAGHRRRIVWQQSRRLSNWI